jgi:uncharacterized protein (TIGR03032 family)
LGGDSASQSSAPGRSARSPRGSLFLNRKHLDPSRNIAFPDTGPLAPHLLTYAATDGWWRVLAETAITLVVSREYEHLLYALSWEGTPWLSHLELPHPSGVCFDERRQKLYVSSTRWPNQMFEFLAVRSDTPRGDLLTDEAPSLEDRTLLLPVRSWMLPGSLDIHEVALLNGSVVFTATGHNFLARLREDGGWQRIWWPRVLDDLPRGDGRRPFDQKYLQLNGMAIAPDLGGFLFTAFSDETSGPKPWKAGYGPRGKGVVFSGATRSVVARGFTCPHSIRWRDETAWLCDSGFGTVGHLDGAQYVPRLRVPGFTRGLAFHGPYGFVGLSRIIPKYDSYAPGVRPEESLCGVVAFETASGSEVGRLIWPEGFQIFDVQVLRGVRKPLLPPSADRNDGNKAYLLHYGYDRDAIPD